MSAEDLSYRLGTGPGGPNIEDGMAWAAANDFHFLDFNADHGPNALGTWDDDRVRRVRQACEQHDLHLGIHTLSAVNVAEFSPYLSESVDAYLRANIDLGVRLGVHHVITHAGLHQSSELDLRKQASLEHLQRAAAYAEQHGATLVLENLNFEPLSRAVCAHVRQPRREARGPGLSTRSGSGTVRPVVQKKIHTRANFWSASQPGCQRPPRLSAV